MIIIFWITGILSFIYLAYPIFLWLPGRLQKKNQKPGKCPDGVSIILLTYNGGSFVNDKIAFLLEELKSVKNGELIIIDDDSSDETRDAIEKYMHVNGIHIILKNQQSGIPDSMNLGVSLARNEVVVFSDQRQQLLPGSLKKILAPMADPEIGAVSGCISHVDKANCKSVARIHENYIKAGESRIGGLMGVYGPLYAIRKKSYSPIPENIILDDLYLSLKILENKKIVLVKNCAIIDEKFSKLYNYKRARRYLTGLVQIITCRPLIRNLAPGKLVMLILHKYLRLAIVGFLFLVYVTSGVLAFNGNMYLTIFIMMSSLGVAVSAQMIFKFKSGFLDVIRINFYYLAAAAGLFVQGFRIPAITNPETNSQHKAGKTMVSNISSNKTRQVL